MSADLSTARDEILTLFRTAWRADATSLPVALYYDDVTGELPRDADTTANPDPWAHIQVRHVTGDQATLAGATGQRRFRRTGLVFVRVYTPFGQGLSLNDALAMIAVRAFEGKKTPSDVWFRGVRSEENGIDGAWFLTTVTAEFLYDEVR